MNPKELAAILGHLWLRLEPTGVLSHNDTAAMRQATDLLATARVEWRGQMKGRARCTSFHEDDLTSWQLLGARIESRHVIETSWVAEDRESEPKRNIPWVSGAAEAMRDR